MTDLTRTARDYYIPQMLAAMSHAITDAGHIYVTRAKADRMAREALTASVPFFLAITGQYGSAREVAEVIGKLMDKTEPRHD